MSALLQASDGETKFDLEDLLGLTPEESEDGYRHASDIKVRNNFLIGISTFAEVVNNDKEKIIRRQNNLST